MPGLTSRLPEPSVSVGDSKQVVLTCVTGAQTTGDIIADLQEVTDFVRADGATATIKSITVLDKDDQAIELDFVIGPTAVSLGTEGAAVDITDAEAEELQLLANVVAADYTDLIGCQIATITDLNLVVKAAPGSRSLYIGAITRGSPTYSAAGLVLQIGLLWD